MNCKQCNYQNPNDAQFCVNCGRPIEKEKIANLDISKLQKSLKDTGNSVTAIGWLTVLGNIGIYIWSLLDKNYTNSGLPKIDTTGLVLILIIAVVFIILGNRVAKANDKNTKKYLIILLVLSVVTLIWIIFSGGKVGLLYMLVLGYLITSLISVNKASKNEGFKFSLITPNYKLKKKGWVIFFIVAAVLLACAFGVDVYRIKTYQYPGFSKTETINTMVKQAKSSLPLPYQVDQATKMVDITAEPDAIRYHYTISGVDENKLSNASLKNSIKATACNNAGTKKILDSDINLEFSYLSESSTTTYFVLLNKADCP